jgi:hypothetical protein
VRPQAEPPPPPEAEATVEAEATAEPAPPPTLPIEPAPALTVTTRVEGADVLVTLSNESSGPVSFASELILESQASGAWEPVHARGRFVARLDAEHALPPCAALVAGASLELTYPGLVGTEPEDRAEAQGAHRFVVTSCSGTGRNEAAAFTVSR